jgi:hypothetical protein
VASGQSYTISAHGHDSDGNLTNVNVWRNGVPYAFAGGGNGTDNDSGNPSTDAGPLTIVYTAEAMDAAGLRSATISQTVTVTAPPAVTGSISADSDRHDCTGIGDPHVEHGERDLSERLRQRPEQHGEQRQPDW